LATIKLNVIIHVYGGVTSLRNRTAVLSYRHHEHQS